MKILFSRRQLDMFSIIYFGKGTMMTGLGCKNGSTTMHEGLTDVSLPGTAYNLKYRLIGDSPPAACRKPGN